MVKLLKFSLFGVFDFFLVVYVFFWFFCWFGIKGDQLSGPLRLAGLSPLPADVSPEGYPLDPVLVALPYGLLEVPVAKVLLLAGCNFRFFCNCCTGLVGPKGVVLADVLPHLPPLLNFVSVGGQGTSHKREQCLGSELQFLILGNGWVGVWFGGT